MTYLSSLSNNNMAVISQAARVQQPFITTIEWEMLDKKRFYPLSMMSSFTVRCFLYPLTLIRTRLQVTNIILFLSFIFYINFFPLRFNTKMLFTRELMMHINKFQRLKVTGDYTGVSGYQHFRSID